MSESGFVVAVDLGTSKIVGVVAKRDDNGKLFIIAGDSVPSDHCVRRGLVYNIDQAGAKVRKLKSLLENKMGRKIDKVYLSVGGQSLHSMVHSVKDQLSSSGIITENIVNKLQAEAEKCRPDLSKVYKIADVEYIVDDNVERNPIGVTGNSIQADFQMVVGRPNLALNLEKCIVDKAGLNVAGFIVGALASADIILNKEEKELGCAFIDFGGGTTTLSIYKDGILRYLVTIPFGGRNLTKDICAMNYIEDDAEHYKVNYGQACDDEFGVSLKRATKDELDLKEMNNVINLRLAEITENIKEQIRKSGYADKLGSGVVIAGGGSSLKNIDIYLKNILGLSVRRGSAKEDYFSTTNEIIRNTSFSKVLGMLMFATINCEKLVPVEDIKQEEEEIVADEYEKEQPRPKEVKKEPKDRRAIREGKNIFNKMGGFFGSIFDEVDNE